MCVCVCGGGGGGACVSYKNKTSLVGFVVQQLIYD